MALPRTDGQAGRPNRRRTRLSTGNAAPGVSDEVVPLGADLSAAARLGRAAILGRPWIESRGPEIAEQYESALRRGERLGALFRRDGVPVGVAVWQTHGPLGLSVNLLYLEPEVASLEAYRPVLARSRLPRAEGRLRPRGDPGPFGGGGDAVDDRGRVRALRSQRDAASGRDDPPRRPGTGACLRSSGPTGGRLGARPSSSGRLPRSVRPVPVPRGRR